MIEQTIMMEDDGYPGSSYKESVYLRDFVKSIDRSPVSIKPTNTSSVVVETNFFTKMQKFTRHQKLPPTISNF